MRHLALSCFALQTRVCSASALAKMDLVEFSDLHLEVPWECSTGQACLVTPE